MFSASILQTHSDSKNRQHDATHLMKIILGALLLSYQGKIGCLTLFNQAFHSLEKRTDKSRPRQRVALCIHLINNVILISIRFRIRVTTPSTIDTGYSHRYEEAVTLTLCPRFGPICQKLEVLRSTMRVLDRQDSNGLASPERIALPTFTFEAWHSICWVTGPLIFKAMPEITIHIQHSSSPYKSFSSCCSMAQTLMLAMEQVKFILQAFSFAPQPDRLTLW